MSEHTEPRLPNPRAAQPPPLMEVSFAALGWLQRAGQAVGSARFVEAIRRAGFYLEKTAELAQTPGERAVVDGLEAAVDNLIAANAEARSLLARSCADMMVADVAEFIELIEEP